MTAPTKFEGPRKSPARPRTQTVDPRRVIDEMHNRYARTIADAFQNNAELVAALEDALNRNDELETQVEALRTALEAKAARAAVPVKPIVDAPQA